MPYNHTGCVAEWIERSHRSCEVAGSKPGRAKPNMFKLELSVSSLNAECVSVCGVLRGFQQRHITTVTACHDTDMILSAANTDARWRRHKTQLHHPVTLYRLRANQSWFYPPNADRQAKKDPVPIITHLVWRGWRSNPRPSYSGANALITRSIVALILIIESEKLVCCVYILAEKGTV